MNDSDQSIFAGGEHEAFDAQLAIKLTELYDAPNFSHFSSKSETHKQMFLQRAIENYYGIKVARSLHEASLEARPMSVEAPVNESLANADDVFKHSPR